MPIYETKGVLTGTIEPQNVSRAQAYLQEDDMTKYLDPPLQGVVLFQQWQLDANGHDYVVLAVTKRELTEDELKLLADNTSGQNSDGLGESFEQQDFAWLEEDYSEEDCGACAGSGQVDGHVEEGDDDLVDCGECDGAGYLEGERDGRMCSFDWQTNDCTYTLVG